MIGYVFFALFALIVIAVFSVIADTFYHLVKYMKSYLHGSKR